MWQQQKTWTNKAFVVFCGTDEFPEFDADQNVSSMFHLAGFGMLSNTWLRGAGVRNMLMAGRNMASLCFFARFGCACSLKSRHFGFCSVSVAFKPLLSGAAASAKQRFGLLSKTQTRETAFTYFTVCSGETFGLTTAVEAGSCTSAAHAVKRSGNTHKSVYYSLQGAGLKLNMVFDMSPNKYFNHTLQ